MTVTLRMDDFVICDSGEGRQIDLTLHRLIEHELDREPPPVTPSTTFNAVAAFSGACVTLALAALPMYWPWLGGKRLFGYGIGILAGGALAISTAQSAFKAIRAKPDEVTGKPLAAVSAGLGGLAALCGVAWIALSVVRNLTED